MITRRDFLKVSVAGSVLASVGQVKSAKSAINVVLPDENFCFEKGRRISVIANVDLVVVGGSSRAVAVAVAARKKGLKVFLVAEMSYLGDDICGSFLYEKKEDEILNTPISYKLFERMVIRPRGHYPTPLHIKKTLEQELIKYDVDFLYSCYVTNVLCSSDRSLAGVIISNRSGRQAIRAKAIIDATHTGMVARMSDAKFTSWNPVEQDFSFTVVGEIVNASNVPGKVEKLGKPFIHEGKKHSIMRYTDRHTLVDESYAALMQIEHKMRSAVWDVEQKDSSDLLWYIPQQEIVAKERLEMKPDSLRDISADIFQPKGMNNLWVFGPCASIDRELAACLMRPIHSLFLGDMLGANIASAIKALPKIDENIKVKVDTTTRASNYGELKELLAPLRESRKIGEFASASAALPVIGKYDVLVLGGGTAGAPAAISAARQGVKTLLLEYLHGLGGLCTLGQIGNYWYGYRKGFTDEINKGVVAMAPVGHPRQLKNQNTSFQSDWKQEWYRREILKAGGDLWFGVMGCGAIIENNKVKGVVVSTPFGRGVILAEVIIDSTGSADTAIAAGAAFEYTGKNTLAIQGAGLGQIYPGSHYNNNDWAFIDDTDILDVSRAYVEAKPKFQGAYDLVKLPQTRERRRIVGEYSVSVCDVINERHYEDTISYHYSNFDTHGMIVDPFFMLSPPDMGHKAYYADVPLRSLLPKGMDGIMVTGLGASAHRDSMPVIRMQPCLQNQGYAAGYLAAQCVKEKKPIRKINIKDIQKHLVGIGNLPERVLKDKEFKGFSKSEMKEAALHLGNNYKGLEILLTDQEKCIEVLISRMKQTSDFKEQVVISSVLCLLGNPNYARILSKGIQAYETWDKGWHYTGMGQFGMSNSLLDAKIIALGRAKGNEFASVVIEKSKLLEPERAFSHFLAVSLAAISMKEPNFVATLYSMLIKPGVQGHAAESYREVLKKVVLDDMDTSARNLALKEIHLAHALYECGDKNGLGESILRQYANGLNGHYSRYASEVLNAR